MTMMAHIITIISGSILSAVKCFNHSVHEFINDALAKIVTKIQVSQIALFLGANQEIVNNMKDSVE